MCIVKNSDELISIIQLYGEYDVGESGRSNVSYNWEAAERYVCTKYVINKPIIDFKDEDLPSFVYQEDSNLLNQIRSLKCYDQVLIILELNFFYNCMSRFSSLGLKKLKR